MPEDDGPDEMETMTQNDDELIDHQLLKRVGDNVSNGSNDNMKNTARSSIGQKNKSVEVIFKERIVKWKKSPVFQKY